MTGTDYLIGDIVCHARYGHGKVVETGGGVLGAVIKVRFGKVEKRLLPSIAPLEKIASAEDEDPADLDELVELLRLENGDDDETTASRKLYSTQKDKGRVKGYAEWNPHKKTRVIMAQVKETLAEYYDELPLTARQIFYRLVGKYGYPKTENAAESLNNWLVRARRSRRTCLQTSLAWLLRVTWT